MPKIQDTLKKTEKERDSLQRQLAAMKLELDNERRLRENDAKKIAELEKQLSQQNQESELAAAQAQLVVVTKERDDAWKENVKKDKELNKKDKELKQAKKTEKDLQKELDAEKKKNAGLNAQMIARECYVQKQDKIIENRMGKLEAANSLKVFVKWENLCDVLDKNFLDQLCEKYPNDGAFLQKLSNVKSGDEYLSLFKQIQTNKEDKPDNKQYLTYHYLMWQIIEILDIDSIEGAHKMIFDSLNDLANDKRREYDVHFSLCNASVIVRYSGTQKFMCIIGDEIEHVKTYGETMHSCSFQHAGRAHDDLCVTHG